MASSPNTSWQTEEEKMETVTDFIFLSSKITVDSESSHEIKRCLLLRQCIKKQRHHFVNKDPHNQSYGFSNNHVRMWELNHKEGWELKNRCFWIVLLEKTLETPLVSREIKPIFPKGSWPLNSLEGLMLKLNTLAPDTKSWLIGKDPDAGEDWR